MNTPARHVRYLFARLLQDALDSDGHSQLAIARKVTNANLGNLSQATLSEWARGAVLPKEDDPRLTVLAGVLNCPGVLDTWRRCISEDVARRADEGVLPLTRHLLYEARELISDEGCEGLHIWMLNPRALPLLQTDSASVVDLWAQNLLLGANYCILWTDDVTDEGLAAQFASKVSLVANRFKEFSLVPPANHAQRGKAGLFLHYVIPARDGAISARMNASLRRLERLAERGGPEHQISEINPKDEHVQDILRGLYDYLTAFAAVVCYVWPGKIPLANVCLNNVRLPCDESSEHRSVGLWLDEQSSVKLKGDLEDLQQRSQPKSKGTVATKAKPPVPASPLSKPRNTAPHQRSS